MPKALLISDELRRLITAHDAVVTTAQLVDHGIGRSSVSHRTQSGRWRWLLPGVVLTHSGYPTRRQRVIATWLWAGPRSAIDAESACYWYGIGSTALRKVHVVVPWESAARSQSFVVVRRTIAEITVGARAAVPYVDAPTALVVAARDAGSSRAAITLLSRGLQTGLATEAALAHARATLGDKGCRDLDRALLAVGVGLRSPAEHDFRSLVRSSRRLPEPLWNQWLDLGDGDRPLCVDALWEDAGLVHETNGRGYHAWGLAFEEMQARHDRLTAAGLVVLHNAPTRFGSAPARVISELVRAYERNGGRGLPAQVRLLPPTGAGHCG